MFAKQLKYILDYMEIRPAPQWSGYYDINEKITLYFKHNNMLLYRYMGANHLGPWMSFFKPELGLQKVLKYAIIPSYEGHKCNNKTA